MVKWAALKKAAMQLGIECRGIKKHALIKEVKARAFKAEDQSAGLLVNLCNLCFKLEPVYDEFTDDELVYFDRLARNTGEHEVEKYQVEKAMTMDEYFVHIGDAKAICLDAIKKGKTKPRDHLLAPVPRGYRFAPVKKYIATKPHLYSDEDSVSRTRLDLAEPIMYGKRLVFAAAGYATSRRVVAADAEGEISVGAFLEAVAEHETAVRGTSHVSSDVNLFVEASFNENGEMQFEWDEFDKAA